MRPDEYWIQLSSELSVAQCLEIILQAFEESSLECATIDGFMSIAEHDGPYAMHNFTSRLRDYGLLIEGRQDADPRFKGCFFIVRMK